MGTLKRSTDARGLDGRHRARACTFRVGLISDTHGLLRPEAKEFLAGSDHIVHAGDIGEENILDELRSLAPLSVVRGNNDTEPWARGLPMTLTVKLAGIGIHVLHDRAALQNGAMPSAQVIVTGHSHKPGLESCAGRLLVNPGSAGPRRFKLPVALGDLRIEGAAIKARIVDPVSHRSLAVLSVPSV